MDAHDFLQPLISHEIFTQNHRSKRRQEWYSSVAEDYRWARPHYPATLIDRVLGQAGLCPLDSILEIGCGPGIATAALAKRGLTVTAVEPSEEACKVTRAKLKKYPHVQVIHRTFEEVDLRYEAKTKAYDAVVAATSFHWLSPDVAFPKISRCLKSEGALILLWATPPQPSSDVFAALQPVYVSHDLMALGAEQSRTSAYYRDMFDRFAVLINQSGYFRPSQVEFKAHCSSYSIRKYLALLNTLSGYIALDTSKRKELFEDLRRALEKTLGMEPLQTTHGFASQVAIKL